MTPINSSAIKRIIAILILDRNTFTKGFAIGYKSNTELRLVYNKSLIRIQNAINKYSAKPNPRVTKVKYINDVLTTLALIPKRSAIR